MKGDRREFADQFPHGAYGGEADTIIVSSDEEFSDPTSASAFHRHLPLLQQVTAVPMESAPKALLVDKGTSPLPVLDERDICSTLCEV